MRKKSLILQCSVIQKKSIAWIKNVFHLFECLHVPTKFTVLKKMWDLTNICEDISMWFCCYKTKNMDLFIYSLNYLFAGHVKNEYHI